jgi:type VI secretion system protein ImpK
MTDAPPTSRRGHLALSLQEAFTVAVRLRANRQVAANADSFRTQVKQLLGTADRDARSSGYEGDTVRQAIYAYIAFLDESVLNSSQPMFAAWSQQPLQEEVFGDHIAGENFFRHLAELLARQDSEDLADLLEVYQLCLLLGFRGKYAANPAGLQSISSMVQDKIRRIRGGAPPLAPGSMLPSGEVAPVGRDRWVPRLAAAAGIALLLALGLFILFQFSLGGAVGEIRAQAAALVR